MSKASEARKFTAANELIRAADKLLIRGVRNEKILNWAVAHGERNSVGANDVKSIVDLDLNEWATEQAKSSALRGKKAQATFAGHLKEAARDDANNFHAVAKRTAPLLRDQLSKVKKTLQELAL